MKEFKIKMEMTVLTNLDEEKLEKQLWSFLDSLEGIHDVEVTSIYEKTYENADA